MAILAKNLNQITLDKKRNRIYIIGKLRNKVRRMIELTDIIGIEEKKDTKVHIRKGKGGIIEGAVAGLYSGGGIIQGGLHRRGAEVIRGASYLTVRYFHKGRKESFRLDNIRQPELYEEIREMLGK